MKFNGMKAAMMAASLAAILGMTACSSTPAADSTKTDASSVQSDAAKTESEAKESSAESNPAEAEAPMDTETVSQSEAAAE